MEKECKTCKRVKPLSDFGKQLKCKMGVRPSCKKCYNDKKREYNKQWREDHREYAIEYDKAKRVEKNEHFLEMRRQIAKRERIKHKDKVISRQKAYKVDLLHTCEVCNEKDAVERHHPDYSKPLDVVSVCIPCHKQIHNGGKL